MDARGYNKRVEVWQKTSVFDGYSGNTPAPDELVSKSWANIKTLDSKSALLTDFGLIDASSSILITLRKRNDLTYDLQTMFIMYRGEKYIIKSFPINKDFEDNTISFVCVKDSNSYENAEVIETVTLNADTVSDL